MPDEKPRRVVIAEELAEEIRTNTKLRHRMGMSEGANSGLVDGQSVIGITEDDGSVWFIEVQEA